MIYVDSSVVLAQLLAEDRRPPPDFWQEQLIASRLVEYEVWTRIHGRGLGTSHGEATRQLLGRLTFVALAGPILRRALQPFPSPVRTLDALHLATVHFFRSGDREVQLATYDHRMSEVARALAIPLCDSIVPR